MSKRENPTPPIAMTRTPTGQRLHVEHWLPLPVGDVFLFFSDAGNLDLLTPPSLKFRIDTPLPIDMAEGRLIDYRLRLHGIPIRWRSEISAWEPPFRFVDEQRRGPYRFWVHEHRFEEIDGGTRVIDDVHFGVPMGWMFNRWVARELQKIFTYRSARLREALVPDPAPV